jgi:predicted ribosome quality control (RQC) complex YloA/Tae2 family protein
MKLTLDLKKTVDQNASDYFEKAKKAKKKLEGARKAIEKTRLKLSAEKEKKIVVEKKLFKPSKKDWFENFRWCYSSEGFLMIGGRDAATNEIVIKKHTEKNDLVFHTDMAGSPFVVIKNPENNNISEETKQEAAQLTAAYSRAWKQGITSLEVFCVLPEQVSKQARAGEFLAKGAFMIYGKKSFYSPEVKLAIGVYQGKVMAGPLSAVKAHCKPYVEVMPGEEKPSSIAKLIQKRLNAALDDIIRVLPGGGCSIKKQS